MLWFCIVLVLQSCQVYVKCVVVLVTENNIKLEFVDVHSSPLVKEITHLL